MPKRRAARRSAARRTGHGAAGKVVLLALALCLTASGLTWAMWGRSGTRYTAAPNSVSPPPPPAPPVQAGLHVHDTEEAHVLLEGTAQYRVGEKTFTVHAPYVAKVPAGVQHTFVNAGSKPFNLVAVFASKHPNTKRVGPNPLIPAPKGR